jgi:hypothetical protein
VSGVPEFERDNIFVTRCIVEKKSSQAIVREELVTHFDFAKTTSIHSLQSLVIIFSNIYLFDLDLLCRSVFDLEKRQEESESGPHRDYHCHKW